MKTLIQLLPALPLTLVAATAALRITMALGLLLITFVGIGSLRRPQPSLVPVKRDQRRRSR
jgi:hypothetical protein